MSEPIQGKTFRQIAIDQFNKNRPAVFALRCVIGLFVLAIMAPVLAQSGPFFLWTEKSGSSMPWFTSLFDQNVFPSGVDLFFNLVLVFLPITLLLMRFFRAQKQNIRRSAVILFFWCFVSMVGPKGVVESGLGQVVFAPQHVLRYSKPKVNYSKVRAPALLEILAEEKLAQANKRLKSATRDLEAAQATLDDPAASERDKADAGAEVSAAQTTVKSRTRAIAEWTEKLEQARAAQDDPELAYFAVMPPIGYHHDDNDEERVVNAPTWSGWGSGHFLGTDRNGRDVLARILYGTRVSITIGFIAVAIYCTIGTILGSLMGYFGGKVDMLGMRLVEIMMCFPVFAFLLICVSVFETRSIFLVMVIIGMVGWTGVARLIRGQFIAERNLEYVTAARALAIPTGRIVFKHVLPNAIFPVFVAATFGVAAAILTESGLAFLGLGDPTVPSWGQILLQGRETKEWWLIHSPGFAIFFTVTILNILGEGLRDALDPKLRT